MVGGFLVNNEVLLPVGNSQELSMVLHQKHDRDDDPIPSAKPFANFVLDISEI